jgi:hypothetical protein
MNEESTLVLSTRLAFSINDYGNVARSRTRRPSSQRGRKDTLARPQSRLRARFIDWASHTCQT